ncbi:uncharacterized protein [Thunnus thynnus]|uniref:uncharacterized protein isoform X2 n=1 Tax=Thunnus thynnus TaxID=8237 RepID=UPI0035290501
MKEATPTPGKLIPPVLNKRGVNNSPKQTTSKEMERTPANEDKSPPTKKKPTFKPSTLESADLFDTTTAGASREVSMMLSKFAEVLSVYGWLQ